MKENIALIQEVHHKKPRLEAEAEAIELLEKLGFSSLANKRSNQCDKLEIFYVMMVRALMCDESKVVVQTPFVLVDTMSNIQEVLANIERINQDKGIIILDTQSNNIHYRGLHVNAVQ